MYIHSCISYYPECIRLDLAFSKGQCTAALPCAGAAHGSHRGQAKGGCCHGRGGFQGQGLGGLRLRV